jgi:hypothetical protein
VRTTRMVDVLGVPLQLQKVHHCRKCAFFASYQWFICNTAKLTPPALRCGTFYAALALHV